MYTQNQDPIQQREQSSVATRLCRRELFRCAAFDTWVSVSVGQCVCATHFVTLDTDYLF